MYDFIDTNERGTTYLPAEAMSINGTYLEEEIPGYRTLYVSGREGLVASLSADIVGNRPGSILKKRRMPDRIITVGYQLVASSNSAFREAYSKLNEVLDVKDAKLIFADEPDKYFIGTPSEVGDVEPGRNAIKGEFAILCLDPYKYALNETVVEGVEDGDVTLLSTNNDGGAGAFPSFEVQFADDTSSSGTIGNSADCGYVMMTKSGTDYSLQFGDDEEKDIGSVTAFATDFRSATKGALWNDNTTLPLPVWQSYFASKPSGSTKFVSNGGGVQVNSYGTTQTAKFFGPLLTAQLSAAADGEFEFSWKQIFALHQTTETGKKQRGIVMILFYNENGQLAYGFGVKKANATALTGEVIGYDSSGFKTLKNGVNFGWTGALGYVAKSGYTARYTTQKLKRVQHDDGLWYIDVNSANGNFSFGGYESAEPIKTVGIFLGRYHSTPLMSVNAFSTAQLLVGDVDLINTFGANDLLEIDCSSMGVLLNNKSSDGIGDVSNSWSNMSLDRGFNMIVCQWSDWVPTDKKPTFKMKYRKRWL